MAKQSKTAVRTFRARRSKSAVVPPPWWTSASAWRDEIPTEPAGCQFHPTVAKCKTWHLLGRVHQSSRDHALGEPGGELGRDNGIGEERTRAAPVGILLVEHHGFLSAQGQHGLADFGQAWLGVARKSRLEFGVAKCGAAASGQAESHGEDHKVATLVLEQAGAVAKFAVFRGEIPHFKCVAFENANASDRLGDFLPVGADVLHRRCADRAGNAGQALDARGVSKYRFGHQAVPGLASLHLDAHLAADLCPAQAARAHVQDEPRKPLVGNHQIRPAAENEGGQVARFRPAQGSGQVRGVRDLGEELRRSTQTQGGQGRERYG